MSGPGMGYVAAGYVISAVVLAGYAARVLIRGRRLTRTLPPEERTWR